MRYEDVQHRNHAINYHGCCLDEFVSNILQRTPDAEDFYHKLVLVYRKGHCCDTALLSLTEQWRKELDNQKIVRLLSMDLSKAFDMQSNYPETGSTQCRRQHCQFN